MGEGVYVEENGIYQIDCTSAVWSTDQIHQVYQIGGTVLSDADFAVETTDFMLLIEYKNADFSGVVNPGAFDPASDKMVNKIARKFYDSLHYFALERKTKPVKYIYIVEYPNAGITERKLLRNAIAAKLPFQMQQGKEGKLIEDFKVVSIEEWNLHSEYSVFPLSLVKEEADK